MEGSFETIWGGSTFFFRPARAWRNLPTYPVFWAAIPVAPRTPLSIVPLMAFPLSGSNLQPSWSIVPHKESLLCVTHSTVLSAFVHGSPCQGCGPGHALMGPCATNTHILAISKMWRSCSVTQHFQHCLSTIHALQPSIWECGTQYHRSGLRDQSTQRCPWSLQLATHQKYSKDPLRTTLGIPTCSSTSYYLGWSYLRNP